MAGNDFSAEPGSEEESEEGFDVERLKEIAGFVARAPRRRPRLAIAVLAVGLVGTAAATVLTPRVYESQVRILAQKNMLIPTLDTGHNIERTSDTQHVGDTILRRENLIALVKEVNLLDRWDSTRPPILRFKDKVIRAISGKQTEEDKIRGLVGYVEKQLQVNNDDTSVTITVDWPDPQMAYELASTVQKNFVEAHYDGEVAMINDALAILEEHAKEENDNIGVALSELEQSILDNNRVKKEAAAVAEAAQAQAATPGSPTYAPRSGGAPKAQAIALDPAAKLLEEKRKAIKELDEQKQHRIADLNGQLQNAQITLAPAHPMVIALQQRLDEAKKDPPELAALRADERAIVAQLAGPIATPAPTAGGAAPSPPSTPIQRITAPTPAPAPAPSPTETPAQIVANAFLTETPQVSIARNKLMNATGKYTLLESRIDAAKIELDVTRAAFKYRFSIVTPAEVPRKPRKPNVVILVLGGLVASIVFALGAATAKDYLEGRFIEAWQVRRRLNIPLLGEVDYPS